MSRSERIGKLIARWLLKRRYATRHRAYSRYCVKLAYLRLGMARAYTRPREFEEWELYVYGDNINPYEYDV